MSYQADAFIASLVEKLKIFIAVVIFIAIIAFVLFGILGEIVKPLAYLKYLFS